ncbi:MAG TPA: GNAT family N-acetyltransferase [Clostridiales bacterium]|nr:GNAT family N-acetyltransferase [Clostridiales bacterium]
MIRNFTMEDYDEVYQLWKATPGMGLRSLDDSREGIARFVRRNPNTNFVAVDGGSIIGAILSGHDGRRGFLYHACVKPSCRRRSIGGELVGKVTEAMGQEGIIKLSLVCFSENEPGNRFWEALGWTKREELNFYSFEIL